MYLHSYRIHNFRRLQDVLIELASDISIFVGSNNSGKTSATQVLHAFVAASKDKFSLYDFSSSCWKIFDLLGETPAENAVLPKMPAISLDLWFDVSATDLHLVLPLLPSLTWQGTQVGIRVEFAAKNDTELLDRFKSCREKARQQAEGLEKRENDPYVPWPATLTEFLKSELSSEFEFKYFALDRSRFDNNYQAAEGNEPLPLGKDPGGAAILRALIKIDNLSAQRHLSDPDSGAGGVSGRAENLSRRLSKFYKRNLDQRQEDHQALRALFDSEIGLNKHLSDVFKSTLDQLSSLGYPGLHNPRLEIRSALNPATIMSSQDARVHYVLGEGDDALRLPDSYNGLGFKNLIYMVVEILDLHARWIADKESRAQLHLIFIEEPEAHLHAQLQQVFIRKVLDLIKQDQEDGDAFRSQTVVTTHSPHIVYERGFQPIRYFKRKNLAGVQTTEVLNLSAYYNNSPDDRDFLQRYLKLTHCDLFFADAAILVEGNVERLLLPVMIEQVAAPLQSACLSILEVGGAFAFRFRSLIEFLGLTALIITDLDSVTPIVGDEAVEDGEDETEFEVPDEDVEKPALKKRGKSCIPSVHGAVTSNQTLIKWIPKKQTISELFAATPPEKEHAQAGDHGFKIRVAYQTPVEVVWNAVKEFPCGRTLEVAFGLENASLVQQAGLKHVGLKVRGNPANPSELAEALHKRVGAKSFDKTNFALGVLSQQADSWRVPQYIREGLEWLRDTVKLDLPSPLPAGDVMNAEPDEVAE